MTGPDTVKSGKPSKTKKIGVKVTFSLGALKGLFGWLRFKRKTK